MGGSWVGGSWIVGGGSCLFEDKKKIYIYIYISSLSARSKFVLGLRSCLFRQFPFVDKEKG